MSYWKKSSPSRSHVLINGSLKVTPQEVNKDQCCDFLECEERQWQKLPGWLPSHLENVGFCPSSCTTGISRGFLIVQVYCHCRFKCSRKLSFVFSCELFQWRFLNQNVCYKLTLWKHHSCCILWGTFMFSLLTECPDLQTHVRVPWLSHDVSWCVSCTTSFQTQESSPFTPTVPPDWHKQCI